MNTDKYNKAAYKLTVYKEAARLLREMYFPEGRESPDLFCDQVFRASREVPSEIFQEVIVELHKAERSEEMAMMKFRLEEKTDDEVRTLSEEPPVGKEEDGPSEVPRRPAPAKPAKGRGRKAAR